MSGALGLSLGSTCPPATCTHTLTPMSAVAVLMVEESFVLVKSPVTADGVINSVTPLPLEVLIVVSSITHSVPSAVGVHSGLKLPVLELSVQIVGLTAAVLVGWQLLRYLRPVNSVRSGKMYYRSGHLMHLLMLCD